MADIAARRIDVVVVYKVDRLTRSLMDFARIVESFDAAGVSFVSVTQAFNTTTSMGRLTLNVLLSFAQFEREVTGERIRDKIAASKRKGMWMGGPVPLGYAVENRRLVVVPAEADQVRQIYQRYLELNSVVELAEDLNRQGYRTKIQQRTSGPHRGGCLFRRGTLYHLLANPIYRGKIVHKGEVFEGEHEAIVSLELWNDVHATLRANASGSSKRLKVTQPSLLVGLLTDGEGRAMTPSHATKPGKRYRYYVTRPDQLEGEPAWRVSAHDLEGLVCSNIAGLLTDQQAMLKLAGDQDAQAAQRQLAEADLAAARLRSGTAHTRASLLEALRPSIRLSNDSIDISLERPRLADTLGVQLGDGDSIELTCPATRVRRGHQLRLVIPSQKPINIAQATRDEKLVALVSEAHLARQLVLTNPERSIAAIAADHGRCRTRLGKLAALSCLAPDIVTAIVEGRQPPTLTARTLQDIDLPLAWTDQRALLGFA